MSGAISPIETEPVPRLAFTLTEAAESIGVSEKTVRNWINDGDGPPVLRRGQIVRIPVREFREWLASRSI